MPKEKRYGRYCRCKRCEQPITDEKRGGTEYDAQDRAIAFYCGDCMDVLETELEGPILHST